MTNAEVVVQFAQRIWGDDWLDEMGEFISVNERTLKRISAAARDGEEYPAARGVIAALREHLIVLLDDLEPWARRADEG